MSPRPYRAPKIAVALVAMGLTLAQPSLAQGPEGSVFSTVMNDPRFATTMQMLYMTGYVHVGSGHNPLTVFAPVDAAWSAYGGMLPSLSGDASDSEFSGLSEITKILRGLAARGVYPKPGAAAGPARMTSLTGGAITLNVAAMTVSWIGKGGRHDTARIVGAPIMASNGVVYPVDAVVGQ